MNTELRKRLGMEVEPEGAPFPPPVFIMGCMRSGTTFLVDKLTQHPQLLKVGSELQRAWTQWGDAPCESVCAYRDETHVNTLAAVNMAHYFGEFLREAPSLKRHLMRAKATLGRKQGAITYDWKRVRPVNKSTQLVNKIAYVHGLFPKSQLIFIIRSIQGQCASMKSFIQHYHQTEGLVHHFPEQYGYSWTTVPKGEMTGTMNETNTYPGNFAIIPRMWLRLNYVACKHLSQLPRESFRVVAYEDTVNEQARLLQTLFDFLQLDERHREKAQKIAAAQLNYKNTTTQGDPLTKWKKHLDQDELLAIEQEIAAHKEQFEFVQQVVDQHKL